MMAVRPNALVHLAPGFPENYKYRIISLTQKLSKQLGPCDLVKPVARRQLLAVYYILCH